MGDQLICFSSFVIYLKEMGNCAGYCVSEAE